MKRLIKAMMAYGEMDENQDRKITSNEFIKACCKVTKMLDLTGLYSLKQEDAEVNYLTQNMSKPT